MKYKKSIAWLQLETANFGSGVIRVTGSLSGQMEVNYFLTDHLGSVRVIIDGAGAVKERNDYYPFGARHMRGDYPKMANRLLYNGKEEQVTGDLKYLDYGVRMYDSGLGRWFGIDPKSESYFSTSVYAYCNNSPVVLIDANGEYYDWYLDENEKFVYNESIYSQKDLDKNKIKGKYLGQTYIEGDTYYSLFGDIEDLTTWRGKLSKKLDELFINNYHYNKAMNKLNSSEQDEPVERSVNFDIGLKFKRDKLELANGNIYSFKYQGSNAFYFVSENMSRMNGIFDSGDNELKLNSRISSISLGVGYNMYVNVKGSNKSKIIIFVFPTLKSKKVFYKKWQEEYERFK